MTKYAQRKHATDHAHPSTAHNAQEIGAAFLKSTPTIKKIPTMKLLPSTAEHSRRYRNRTPWCKLQCALRRYRVRHGGGDM